MKGLSKVPVQLPEKEKKSHAFVIGTGSLSASVPPYPSIYHWLKNWAPQQPEYVHHALLGKVAMISPTDAEHSVGHFILPEGHPNVVQDAGQIMALPISRDVVDVIVNSGALTGIDNVVLGISENGVVVEAAIFVEVEQ